MVLDWPDAGLGECFDIVVGATVSDFAVASFDLIGKRLLKRIEETCNQKTLQSTFSAVDRAFHAISI